MRPLTYLFALTLLNCASPDDAGDELAVDLPPGAASKADGQLDVVANHCEVFFDRVVTSRSSHALLKVRLYVKTFNDRLDGDVAEVAYFARLTTENGGTCGDSSACEHENEWRAYRADSFVGATDYWTLDLTLAHDFTDPLEYEGALHVRTTTGKTYWVNPAGGGNFFVDRNMAHNVENVLGGFSFSRGIGPDVAAVTADRFPYLNPRRCQ